MKTVKLRNVQEKGWKLSPSDRLNINSIKSSEKISDAMTGLTATIQKSMEVNIEVISKIAEHMDSVIKNLGQAPARIAASPPTVEVILPPPDKEKKAFRVTPKRDENRIIEYLDIKQL
jgi:hypothetical protein